MSDLQIPLNRLKFGHEDGAGINARVVGRQDGIAELAVNLHARGQIENLIVKDMGDGFYAVSNGNRRLAAFHMLFGENAERPINCTLREVDEAGAFEDSLTTAVTARQLHPVDQYEAFARLEERGKTEDDIARQYGMTEKEVRQALALGRLSPKIRQAWRAGEIKAEVAQAFTLGVDHKTQDRAFDKLAEAHNLYPHWIKRELGGDAIDAEVSELMELVGAQAYRDRGGQLIEDLFGSSHIVTDVPLLKQMVTELLDAKCQELRDAGWGWVELEDNLPHGSRFWPTSKPKQLIYEGNEEEELTRLNAELQKLHDQDDGYDEDDETALALQIDIIETAALARSFDAKQRKRLGCIVDVEDGHMVVLYGVKRPAEASASSGDADDEPKPAPSKTAAASADEPDISNALLHRLSLQLTKAAATALIQDEQLALSVLLAGIGCYSDCGVKVSINGLAMREGGDRGLLGANEMDKALAIAAQLKPAERVSLLVQAAVNALDFQCHNPSAVMDGPWAICNAIDPKMFNAAARGAFDAKDYFGGVNKALCLNAIEEAMGADMARQQGKNSKNEIAAFAIENVPKTGWLPPQLRAKGYDGPPVKTKGKTAPAEKAKPKAAKSAAKKPAKAGAKAAAKKPAKKTAKKKK